MSSCKGEQFSNRKEGIWLDSLFAEKNNLKIGDTISFHTNGISLKLKISGTVLNLEYVYAAGKNEIIPNHKNFGFGFISKKSYPSNMNLFYTDLLIKTDREPDSKLEEDIDHAMDSHYSVYLTRDNLISYNTFLSELKQHKATGSIFPIIFLGIAMLTILTTMTRIVNHQRTQIGVLKAMGFQRNKILYHYISYGFWLSLIGSLLGAIYRSPISQGIQMSRQRYEKYGYHFTPTSIITSKTIHNLPDGVASKWTVKDLTHSYRILMESMNMVVYVLIVAAILLAAIVLYNLGILSFTERLRELATLKVIGFQSKKIRYLLLTQNIWLTIIGIMIGIPTGKLFIDIMMSTMGDSFDMMSILNTSTLIYSIGIALVVSVFVNLLFSGKIKRIDMVSSLKGVE